MSVIFGAAYPYLPQLCHKALESWVLKASFGAEALPGRGGRKWVGKV